MSTRLLAQYLPAWTESLSDLGTQRQNDQRAYAGVAGGLKIMHAEIYFSWSALAGGDGASNIRIWVNTYATNVQTADGDPTENRIVVRTDPSGSFATAANVYSGFTDASGARYAQVEVRPYSSSGGSALPFPPYWALFISNSSTAYTGGTVTVDKIKCYGG